MLSVFLYVVVLILLGSVKRPALASLSRSAITSSELGSFTGIRAVTGFATGAILQPVVVSTADLVPQFASA